MKKCMHLMFMIALLAAGSVQAAPDAPPVTSGLVMHFDASAITDAVDGLYHVSLPQYKRNTGGYGYFWSINHRKNALHIFASTLQRFYEALEGGENEPADILNEGTLIYGQFDESLKEAVWYGGDQCICDCR